MTLISVMPGHKPWCHGETDG